MIKIKIPNNNIKEREYIIDIIFGEFLGLSYQLIIDNGELKINDWIIELENGNILIVKDHFFNKYPKDLEYLNIDNIPKKIEFTKNEFTPEDDIVVIFGNAKEVIEDSYIEKQQITNHKSLITRIDLFASSFFMLTRWEEYVIKAKDNHGRFLESEALAVKFGFINRPIVNEYVQMLLNMLNHLGLKQKATSREYKLTVTHDVDYDLLFKSPSVLIRRVGADLLKRKDLPLVAKTIKAYFSNNDPYDVFDFFMDESEKMGVKSHFFFMAKGSSEYDNNYESNSDFIKSRAERIKKRGHIVGIHYTYNAFNSKEQLKQEIAELEANFNTKIECGRNHYLRFEVPTSWQILDEFGMKWDSTCGYEGHVGFRCGVCYEFSVFDILKRKKLNLKERPLLVMETTLLYFQSSGEKEDEFLGLIEDIKNKTKKYNGEFVLLWHNNNLDFLRTPKYRELYKKTLGSI